MRSIEMAIYLGIDSSTQSVSAVAIEVEPSKGRGGPGGRREVVAEASVNFESELPHHGTKNGVLAHDDPRVAHSPPLLWVEALDRIFPKLREAGLDLAKVRAIAGSGQQHGSVYLNAKAGEVLAKLDAGRPLADQLKEIFSRATSPIWMDSSTARECREIEKALGGAEDGALALARLTGSRAFERFTGPQIRKFHRESPEGYQATDRIHLVSSFMATLLAGRHAPLDPGDGAGMNLMDLAEKRWAPRALAATAPDLERRLPPIEPSDTALGPISAYFFRRHGLARDCQAVVWSGDNPSSLIGVGLVRPGRIAISLGTSDTLFGFMPAATVDPAGEGHVFGSPTGHYMSLICFKNGSLAREKVRDRFKMGWPEFNAGLRATPPGNRGRVMLPWFDPEITPKVLEPGVRRYGLPEDDAAGNARAVVEAQMAAMAIHSSWMGVRTETIYATGGAAQNRDLLQVLADIHRAEVYQFQVGKSAALGAALRAYHACRKAQGESIPWEEVVAGFAEPVQGSRIQPDPGRAELYRDFLDLYRMCEDHARGKAFSAHAMLDAFARKYPA
jgi:xylulokinase